jgi:hypothetical protein
MNNKYSFKSKNWNEENRNGRFQNRRNFFNRNVNPETPNRRNWGGNIQRTNALSLQRINE